MSAPASAPASTARVPSIGLVSLGCPKATVDSERILTRLRAEGYQIQPRPNAADLVIVNTCGFIDAAVEESYAAIDEAITDNGRVIVTGCLGARAEQVRSAFPDLLAVTGPQALDEVMAAVHAAEPAPHDPFVSLVPPQGVRLTPRHYAYLKIAEGCGHRCSFCIIPQLRGGLVSRALGEILDEAGRLVDAGVRELLVVAQDTAAYGRDLGYRSDFFGTRPLRSDIVTLARVLGELPAWIRMHYVYPYPEVDRLVELMADDIVLPYLDLPLQHANARILRAMRRPAAGERMLARIAHWRTLCPQLTLRSTFIVGFPGETEAEFEELLAFLQTAELDRVGCFSYSPVDGASANELPDPVPEALKEERRARLMETQAAISRARLQRRVGERMTVLVDAVEDDRISARSSADAPEIDGEVIVPGAWEIEPGDFIEVDITAAGEHDLWAEPITD